MGVGQFSVAYATAIVGYDLATGKFWQSLGRKRALAGIALKGSAAAADTKVELFIDTVKIGEFYNTGTGFANMDDLIPLDMNFVPPHSQIHIYITIAPGTNPITGIVVWKDI